MGSCLNKYRIVSVKDSFALFEKLHRFIMDVACREIGNKGFFTAGLAGGSSPKGLYEIMKDHFPYWEKSYFLPSDERYVPSEDPRSNYRMIRNSLGEKARIYRIKTELPPEQACSEFNRELSKVGRLDFILLGIGEDGHTASLFPKSECRTCGDNACISESPDGLLRISMTLNFINRSAVIAFLAFGDKKRKILETLITGGDIPAGQVNNGKEIYLFTDLLL